MQVTIVRADRSQGEEYAYLCGPDDEHEGEYVLEIWIDTLQGSIQSKVSIHLTRDDMESVIEMLQRQLAGESSD